MSSMRILVVGAGATGGYFGGRLAQAGRDVTFLVRKQRAAQLRDRGLRLRSPHGDATITPQIVESGTLAQPYDVILLGLKAYALEGALDDMAPGVGPNTMIVPMLNGMRHIDLMVKRFGEGPVLGGVCIIAATLNAEGDVVQLLDLQNLMYGERSGEMTARIKALDETMQGAGFPASASPTIMQDMWEKWVTLASLGALCSLMRGNVGQIVEHGGSAVSLAIFDEAAAVASACGYAPREAYATDIRARITAAGSAFTSSMYRDLTNGLPVEADQIIGDMISRGKAHGVHTPLLQAAYTQLAIYQASRASA
jgi:2-dehydropantoate 2-reductase